MKVEILSEYIINKEQENEILKEIDEFNKYLDFNSISCGVNITDETRELLFDYQIKLNKKLINRYVDYIFDNPSFTLSISKDELKQKHIIETTKELEKFIAKDIKAISKIKKISKEYGFSNEDTEELYYLVSIDSFFGYDYVINSYLYQWKIRNATIKCSNECKLAIKEHANFLKENNLVKIGIKPFSTLPKVNITLLRADLDLYVKNFFDNYDLDTVCENYLNTLLEALGKIEFLEKNK